MIKLDLSFSEVCVFVGLGLMIWLGQKGYRDLLIPCGIITAVGFVVFGVSLSQI